MQRFVYLDFFRFIFALLVALLHFRGAFYLERAYLAVDFFFVLSGFVLSHAYLPKTGSQDFLANFFIDRVARLYPLYILTLGFLILLNVAFYVTTGTGLEQGWSYADGYLYTLIVNILLLQNSGLTTGPSWNAPGWSISAEFLANIVLALALVKVSRIRSKAIPAITAGFFALVCYVILLRNLHTLSDFTTNVYGLINAGLLRGAGGVSFGVLCYLAYARLETQKDALGKIPSLMAWGAGLSLTAIIIEGNRIQNADFIALPLTFLFVLGVALKERFSAPSTSRLFVVAQGLGAISYGVYIIHWPVVVLLKWQLIHAMKMPISATSATSEVVFVVVICALALLAHYKFELPAKMYVKRKFRASRPG